MKRIILGILIFVHLIPVIAQDIDYARMLVDTLSSSIFEGRGYVREGDRKAAVFLASECTRLNLIPFEKGYWQNYSFPMNILPGKLEASVNRRSLKPGAEFQVWAASPPMKGDFKIFRLDAGQLMDPLKVRKMKVGAAGKYVLIDKKGIEDKQILSAIDSLRFTNFLGAKGLIFISDTKLNWSVMAGFRPRNYIVMDVRREALKKKPRQVSINVESNFIQEYKSQNVIGYIRGKSEPDSFLVLTAHYDHLGRMGEAVFYPGANDNASGTAMVMDLARHYAEAGNQPYYSMVFILLSGEEAGLHGSEFCAANPPVDLKKVKFLINLDMVGTGSEGITVVNATKFAGAFQRFVKINSDNEYLLTVKERGESCNSDHCPFYKKGVPSVFIYSMGKEFVEYHNPDDQSRNLPLSEYKDLFRLVRDFMDQTKTLNP